MLRPSSDSYPACRSWSEFCFISSRRKQKGERIRGEALRDQGKTVDGERLIGEGDAKIREGEALIRQAQAMPTEPLTMEGGATTQPSMHRTDRMDHDRTTTDSNRTDR
jgi:hypothetical protein